MEEQNEELAIEDNEIETAWSEEEEESSAGSADSSIAEEPEKEEAPADQPEDFTLKHLDETRTVSREEVVTLAQKGMDYDRIRTERDQLRQYRQESDPAMDLVKAYAGKNGMGVVEYIDYCRRQGMVAQDGGETGEAQEAHQRAEARRQDMSAFLDAFPGVKGEDVPKEVWARVAAGESLVTAYTMHKNHELEAALAAERQNRQNQQRTTGSLASPADGDRKDDIDRWWNEEE